MRQPIHVLVPLFVLALSVGSVGVTQTLSPAIFYYASAPELSVGGSVTSELTLQSGQNFKDGSRVEVVVLRSEPGTPVVVDVVSDAFDAYLTVYAPDGSVLDAIDDGPSGVDPQIVFTPRQPGAHLLAVSGFGPWDLGAFEVRARAPEPVETQALPLSGSVEASLQGTEPADPEVGYGPTRSFTLEVEERSLVRLRASSNAFDTVLALFDDEGWLDQNDDAGGTTDSELFLELQPGSYRVAVAAWSEGNGPFTLSAERYVRVD
ncbi:MAG: DVUA0089 family protein [Trueperaceae bacterium]|nr:DVUA0089 family protein [Trueperaceae bacterium]